MKLTMILKNTYPFIIISLFIMTYSISHVHANRVEMKMQNQKNHPPKIQKISKGGNYVR